jgi:hypothetical protein
MSPPRSDEDAAAALADSEAERDGDAIPRADLGLARTLDARIGRLTPLALASAAATFASVAR